MRPSCYQPDLQKRKRTVFARFKHSVLRCHRLVVRRFCIGYFYHLGLLAALVVSCQCVLFFRRNADRHAEIPLVYLPVLDLLVEDTQALGVLCADDYTARVAVYAVAQRRHERVLRLRVIFALVIKIVQDPVYQRVAHSALVLVNYQSALLVAQQKVLVLINDVKTARCFEELGL